MSRLMSPIRTPASARSASVFAAPKVQAGTVLSHAGGAMIALDGVPLAARIAFSCLVQPEPGDTILAETDGTMFWITSILERTTDTPACLLTEGDVRIVSVGGDISLNAGGHVKLEAGIRACVVAPEIDLHAGIARFVLNKLTHVGKKMNLFIKKIRSVGDLVETFAEHVLTRSKRATRFIAESDQLRAGSIDHRAEATLIPAKTTFVSAETVIRMDTRQFTWAERTAANIREYTDDGAARCSPEAR